METVTYISSEGIEDIQDTTEQPETVETESIPEKDIKRDRETKHPKALPRKKQLIDKHIELQIQYSLAPIASKQPLSSINASLAFRLRKYCPQSKQESIALPPLSEPSVHIPQPRHQKVKRQVLEIVSNPIVTDIETVDPETPVTLERIKHLKKTECDLLKRMQPPSPSDIQQKRILMTRMGEPTRNYPDLLAVLKWHKSKHLKHFQQC
ncbi:hypothetical protein EDD86DRAFT_218583 [Gorgonomyces haynaldii]|nr:hypothetical protein EDD86DRAFT_218583 [Gorgonomyces haynaldii]